MHDCGSCVVSCPAAPLLGAVLGTGLSSSLQGRTLCSWHLFNTVKEQSTLHHAKINPAVFDSCVFFILRTRLAFASPKGIAPAISTYFSAPFRVELHLEPGVIVSTAPFSHTDAPEAALPSGQSPMLSIRMFLSHHLFSRPSYAVVMSVSDAG